MGKQRKRHSKEFKARVALDALKGFKTLSELASEHKLHPTQVRRSRCTDKAPLLPWSVVIESPMCGNKAHARQYF